MDTWLEEYARKILDGDIVACRRIKQAYTVYLDKLKNPNNYRPWVYDPDKGEDPITFIESFCCQSSGKKGQKLNLELFQKAKHNVVFGFVHEDERYRQYQETLDIRGRKNGKTTELAADSIYLAIADDEQSPEIYFIATALDQSKKGFTESWKMVQQSELLKKYIRKRAADLYCDMNFGMIKALASNSNTLDGLDAHGVTIDELGAIKNRDIYDLMKQAMSARNQPLLNCISTNGYVREGIFDSQYKYACGVLDGKINDDRFAAFIHELDKRDEWKNPRMWIKANPGLGTIKKYSFLKGCVEKAKFDESFLPTVLVKDFNLIENAASAWLKWDEIVNEETYDIDELKPRYGIGGIDAADSIDLNAAKCIFQVRDNPKIFCKSMYWIPEKVIDEANEKGNRQERDSLPYSLWVAQGLMRVWPGNKVDKICYLNWFKELRDEYDIYMFKIAYDPWHIDDSLLRAFEAEFGKDCMVPIRQGTKTLSQPMKNMRADLGANIINYNNNPIDRVCLYNTSVKPDINGNIQPVKKMKSTERIDGTIALICAYIALQDNKDNYHNII